MNTLFVDLDGVLVDFDAGVFAVTGSKPHSQTPRAMWPRLARTPGFYEHLGWMDGGRELWEAVLPLRPTILTGLPLGRWAEPQKRAWCARELGADVPVITCMSRDKAAKARGASEPGATPVLIDDRESLRLAFEDVGGVFIHYTGTPAALEELGALGNEFAPARV